MKRQLIIPLKRGEILDDECLANIILCPMGRAQKHIEKTISKKFDRWEIKEIEVNYDFSGR